MHILLFNYSSGRIDRECVLGGKEEQFEASLKWELERMKEMDAYIALRGSSNVFESSDLPSADIQRAMKIFKTRARLAGE